MRLSSYIQYPDAIRLLNARHKSAALGMPWNCCIDLHLEAVGIEAEKASEHLRNGLARLRKYHDRRGLRFSAGWVLENSGHKGVHAHLLVHRPKSLAFEWWKYRRIVQECFQVRNEKGSLRARKPNTFPSMDFNVTERLKYMLKGTRPEACQMLGFGHDPQGKIIGKRIGWTRNLN